MILWDSQIRTRADNHAKFIIGLLKTTNGVTIETCEYLVKEVFYHAYKHCEEDRSPKRAKNGKFIK